MTEPDPPPDRASGRQFSLRAAFLFTVVIAITAAVWGGLTREGSNRLIILVFAAAAPSGMIVLLGLWQQWQRLRGRH